MTEIFSILDRSIFMVNLLVICTVFSIPLEKHSRYLLRIIPGALACIAISMLLPYTMLKYVLELAAVSIYIHFICAVTFQDAAYCAICAYATQHFAHALDMVVFQRGTGVQLTWDYLLCCTATYTAFYFIFARRLTDCGHYNVDVRRSLISTATVLLFALCLSTAASNYFKKDNSPIYYVCKGYAMLCCIYALWAQVSMRERLKTQQELSLQQQLWNQKRTQYEMTQQNIDLINCKCHDLKHQISVLRTVIPSEEKEAYLSDLERSIQIYDAAIDTGSQVLDTVLMEKTLLCSQNQITMTCVADGSKLGFMDAVDVYTIFGNALDNAIESVSRVADPERRLIAVSVWSRVGQLFIQFENYYEGELSFQDGLPTTSKAKKEQHGFGMRSIRYSVERYDGCMGIYPEGQQFRLRISIPLPLELQGDGLPPNAAAQ